MSLKNLKKSRMSFDELESKLKTSDSGSTNSYKDDRFWYPARDDSGTGSAVVRFLPQVDGEDLPWVKTFNHGFKDVGGWFVDECPTTIGKDCPVCKANGELWNSGIDADKEIARRRKRKMSYVANIYIVSDPKNPENEGQVKLFRFGKKIFDKIMGAVSPEFDDETPINPFDLWEGANFKFKIRKVDGQTNYDKSEFDSPSQLLPTDGELEAVYDKVYALAEFIADDKFKPYEELEKKFNRVIGKSTPTSVGSADDDIPFGDEPQAQSAPAPTQATADKGDDDVLAYFQGLAEDN